MKMKSIALWVLLLVLTLSILVSCSSQNQVTSANSTSSDSDNDKEAMTDEALIDRTLYLFDMYVFPVGWWTGSAEFALNVNSYVEPLEDTPENTAYYPVGRFESIEDMKRATEQAVTKEYAEEYLYPNLEDILFLERDGKLYYNIERTVGGSAYVPVSASVLSKSESNAVLSIVLQDTYGEKLTNEVEL